MMSIDKQFKTFHEMINKMNPSERELFSDKLLSYLLFNPVEATKKNKSERKNSHSKKSALSADELKLIKELAKRTEELKDLLGDDPDFFS